ncbi:MAG: DUF971 domain-containing protein [Myxococcota bacterium]|nr:DUF971 domain-containing protein [Myxococcota bacterium]
MSSPEPVELRAPEGARRMEIDWSDGSTTAYHHAILRGFCPCAYCQGHQGPVRWVEGAEKENLELAGVEPVGNYALRLSWADGHATGIYTFRFLRALGPVGESDPSELGEIRLDR